MIVALEVAIAAAATMLLWWIAERTAVERAIVLGRLPWGWLCISIAAAAGAIFVAGPVSGVATAAICVAAIVDARSGYIFDPLAGAGLMATIAAACACGRPAETLLGAAATAGTLLAIHLATAGRGLGLGDVKLGALLGAGLGIYGGIAAIGTGFVVGAVAALGALSSGRARVGDTIRFGPYLAAGTLLVLAYHRVNTGVIR